MNILQIVSSSRTSGAEKHVFVLSDRLRQRGHQVTILCPPGGWLPSQLRAAHIPTVEMAMHGLRFCSTTVNLARFVRQHKIDVIHSHLTCATYHGFLTGRLTRLPVVASVHVLTHDFVYRWLLPRRDNRIITVSEYIREALLKQGISAEHVRTIYNGTNFCSDGMDASAEPVPFAAESDLPVRAELSLPPDAELVGLFGRVDEFKGHIVLAQAARQIVQARPRAYFVCVGAVEPPMQKMLWEIAAADGVADRLRFTGVRNDVQRLMAEMDVITLPSRFEACSMAIIEAMAMGKPVVATRAGGNPELVSHGETGLLIERTPPALADALIRLLSDTTDRQRMGEAARVRAETHFSATVMARNIEALYQEMIARHSKQATLYG